MADGELVLLHIRNTKYIDFSNLYKERYTLIKMNKNTQRISIMKRFICRYPQVVTCRTGCGVGVWGSAKWGIDDSGHIGLTKWIWHDLNLIDISPLSAVGVKTSMHWFNLKLFLIISGGPRHRYRLLSIMRYKLSRIDWSKNGRKKLFIKV